MYDRLLNTREVAERLNVSRSYVYYLIGHGELPSIRIRHCVRIHPEALERYIENRLRVQRLVFGQGIPPR